MSFSPRLKHYLEATYGSKEQYEAQVRVYKDKWNEQLRAMGSEKQGTRPAERRVAGLAVMQHIKENANLAEWDESSGTARNPDNLKRLYVWAFEMLRDTAILKHNEEVRKLRQAQKKNPLATIPLRERTTETTAWDELLKLYWLDLDQERFHTIVKDVWVQYYAIGQVPITEEEYIQTEHTLLQEILAAQTDQAFRTTRLKLPVEIMAKCGMTFLSEPPSLSTRTSQTKRELELAIASFAATPVASHQPSAPIAPSAPGTRKRDKSKARQQELTKARAQSTKRKGTQSEGGQGQSDRPSRGREREPRTTERPQSNKRNRTQSPGTALAQGQTAPSASNIPPLMSLSVGRGRGRGILGLRSSQTPSAGAMSQPAPPMTSTGRPRSGTPAGGARSKAPAGGARPKTPTRDTRPKAPTTASSQSVDPQKEKRGAEYYARLDEELAEHEVVPIEVRPAHPTPPPYAVLDEVPDPVSHPAAYMQWRKARLCSLGHAPFEAELKAVPLESEQETLQEFAQLIVASVDLALATTSTDKYQDGAIGGPCIPPALQQWRVGPMGVPESPTNRDIRRFNYREHWVRYMRILQLWAEKSGMVPEGELAQVTSHVWRRLGGIMYIKKKDILQDSRWTIIQDPPTDTATQRTSHAEPPKGEETDSDASSMDVSQAGDDVVMEGSSGEASSNGSHHSNSSESGADGSDNAEGEDKSPSPTGNISMTSEEIDAILSGSPRASTPTGEEKDETQAASDDLQVYVELGVPQPDRVKADFAQKHKEMYEATSAILAPAKRKTQRYSEKRAKFQKAKEKQTEKEQELEHWRRLREEVHQEQATGHSAKKVTFEPEGVTETRTEVVTRLDRSGMITQTTSQTDTDLVTGVSTNTSQVGTMQLPLKVTQVETMQLPLKVTVPESDEAVRIVEIPQEEQRMPEEQTQEEEDLEHAPSEG